MSKTGAGSISYSVEIPTGSEGEIKFFDAWEKEPVPLLADDPADISERYRES